MPSATLRDGYGWPQRRGTRHLRSSSSQHLAVCSLVHCAFRSLSRGPAECRIAVVPSVARERHYPRPVRIHNVDPVVAVTVRTERDLRAVRTPRRIPVLCRATREPRSIRAVGFGRQDPLRQSMGCPTPSSTSSLLATFGHSCSVRLLSSPSTLAPNCMTLETKSSNPGIDAEIEIV